MSLNSTTRTSVISRLQQYELAAADRVDLDEASYGGSSIGIKTSEDRKNISVGALMARNKSEDSRRKQLRGAAAPPPSPKEQEQYALDAFADELRSYVAGKQT